MMNTFFAICHLVTIFTKYNLHTDVSRHEIWYIQYNNLNLLLFATDKHKYFVTIFQNDLNFVYLLIVSFSFYLIAT